MEPKIEVRRLLVYLTAVYQAPSCTLTPDILRSGYSVPHSAEGKTEAQKGKMAGPQSHSLFEAEPGGNRSTRLQIQFAVSALHFPPRLSAQIVSDLYWALSEQ